MYEKITLTRDQLRELVLETSVTYARALTHGLSVQEAELARARMRDAVLQRFGVSQ